MSAVIIENLSCGIAFYFKRLLYIGIATEKLEFSAMSAAIGYF